MGPTASIRAGLCLAALVGLAGCAQAPSGEGAGAPGDGGAILDLQRRAFADNVLMRFEDAERAYRESAQRSAEAVERGSAAQLEQEIYLALNKSNVGEYAPAEDIFAAALPRIDVAGGAVTRVKARVFYAQHKMNQGLAGEALDATERAISLGERALEEGAAAVVEGGEAAFVETAEGLEIPPETARLLGAGGAETAATAFGTGQLAPKDELRVLLAQAHYIAASARLAGGGQSGPDVEEARALLEDVPRGAALWLRAEVARLAADEALGRGDLAIAAEESARAVRIARRYGAGERPEALLRLQEGRIRLEEGRAEAARRSFERALEILARGGRGVRFDALAPYLELLAADPPSPGRDAAIFLALQQLRDPATSETLARLAARLGAGSSEAARAIRALQDAERAVNREAARLDLLTGQQPRDVNAIRVTRERLAEAEAARADAAEAVAEHAPNYRQIVDRSVSLEQVQGDLRPGELLLQVRLGRSGGAIAAITAEGFRLEPLGITEAEAGALVGRIRESVYSPFFDVGAARELYARVIEPVQAEVEAAADVIIAPDGPLLSIPPGLMIAADPVDYRERSLDYSAVPWFGRESAVSVTLSVASFHRLRQVAPSAAPEPFRGFGNFVPYGPGNAELVRARRGAEPSCAPVLAELGRLAPLPGTAEEVRRLARIAGAAPGAATLGAEFTDAAVKEADLADARILHFATHGLLPLSAECLPEPSLATSLGEEGDGLLEAGEIVELRMDADLVVLSACDTGGGGAASALGTGFRGSGGEALSGLVRAFFYAGARNVLASHWIVPDAETVALMEALYSGLAAGETASAAMQRARGALAGDPATSHPYYWAAFSIIGDAAREAELAAAEASRAARAARGPLP